MRAMRIHLKVKHERLHNARGLLRPADVARELGVSPQLFKSYENGVNRVPADVLIRWCSFLRLRPAEVIAEEDKKVLRSLAVV